MAFGCNDKAVVSGSILEDEKVTGFHWAYGRSDHIGGITGVSSFKDPGNVVHQDIVYPKDSPIAVETAQFEYTDKEPVVVISNSNWV